MARGLMCEAEGKRWRISFQDSRPHEYDDGYLRLRVVHSRHQCHEASARRLDPCPQLSGAGNLPGVDPRREEPPKRGPGPWCITLFRRSMTDGLSRFLRLPSRRPVFLHPPAYGLPSRCRHLPHSSSHFRCFGFEGRSTVRDRLRQLPVRPRSEVREVLHERGDLRIQFIVAVLCSLASHFENVRRVFGHTRMIIKRGSGEQTAVQLDAQYRNT